MRKPLAAFKVRMRRLREAGELVTRITQNLTGERKVLLDAILVRGIHDHGATHGAAPLRAFALQQVALARPRAQHLATGGYFEPLGDRFLGLNAFWTSHRLELSLSK